MGTQMKNFDRNQVGMHTQLSQLSDIVKNMDSPFYKHLLEVNGTNMFFCFKWLLIVFKREFPLESVQMIWEVLWSDHYTPQHNLFVCLAMLLQNKEQILAENMEFDDILRVCITPGDANLLLTSP
jgi:TBC1 domain family member 15